MNSEGSTDDVERLGDEIDREPGEGESYDGVGHIRPVPQHVPPTPEDDPFSCLMCGQPLGTVKRVEREEYCDLCLADMGFAVEGHR